jgi:hypothetical protein
MSIPSGESLGIPPDGGRDGESLGLPSHGGLEAPGVPSEEDIDVADMSEELETDPDKVPNAPNRDPAVPPQEDDLGTGDDPRTPMGYESFEDTRGGNYTDRPPR